MTTTIAEVTERAIEAVEAIRAEERARLTSDQLARAFVRIRGAHNPTIDEMDEGGDEIVPCAWCRLAGEQAAEAIGWVATR